MLFNKGVFLIGARKCGTTWLFDLLSSHPRIEATRVKEPAFFCLSEKTIETFLDHYSSMFSDSSKIIMDGSTYYLNFNKSVDNIMKYVADPKFLIIIRDPVSRFFSAYHYVNRFNRNFDQRNLKELVSDYSHLGSEKGYSCEGDMVKTLSQHGTLNKSFYSKDYHRVMKKGPMDTDFSDQLWEFKYLKMSRYSEQIKMVEKQVGGKLKITVLEELIQDTESILIDVFDFLNLDPCNINGSRMARQNTGLTFSNPLVRKFLKVTGGLELNLGIRTAIGNYFGSRPLIPIEYKEMIRELLVDEYTYWYKELPQTRDFWV